MTLLPRIRFLFGAALACLALIGASAAMAQNTYSVRPGDVLRVEVLEDSSLNRSVLVPPDGRIQLPLAGSVQAGGRAVEAIQSDLANLLAPNFATSPNVFVALERLAETAPRGPAGPAPTIDVYVVGEAASPGKLSLEPGTTVLQLVAQMGGFTNFAAKSRLQLRRPDGSGGEQIYKLDYKAIESGRSPNGTVVLADGDVIVIPQRHLFE